MSNPDIIVKPATHTIKAKIIQTLTSRSSSHEKICGYASYIVCDVRMLPLQSGFLFICETIPSAVSSIFVKSSIISSAPVQKSFCHPFSLFIVYISAKHILLSNCVMFVLYIPLIVKRLALTSSSETKYAKTLSPTFNLSLSAII